VDKFSFQKIAFASQSSAPVWPAYLSLIDFVNGPGSQNLNQMIEGYFDGQNETMSNLREEIKAYGIGLVSAIKDFSAHLDSGVTNFDSSFMRFVCLFTSVFRMRNR
jgi:hypothetical protein